MQSTFTFIYIQRINILIRMSGGRGGWVYRESSEGYGRGWGGWIWKTCFSWLFRPKALPQPRYAYSWGSVLVPTGSTIYIQNKGCGGFRKEDEVTAGLERGHPAPVHVSNSPFTFRLGNTGLMWSNMSKFHLLWTILLANVYYPGQNHKTAWPRNAGKEAVPTFLLTLSLI